MELPATYSVKRSLSFLLFQHSLIRFQDGLKILNCSLCSNRNIQLGISVVNVTSPIGASIGPIPNELKSIESFPS